MNILYYILPVTLVAFIAMGIDKYLAKSHARRISEKTLFLLAIIGGSIGSLLGMYIFRHKTKHKSFTIGIPVILLLQLTVAYLIIRYIPL